METINHRNKIFWQKQNMYEMFDLNRLYAIIDNKDSVLIQYFVFDNILQPASFFLGKDTPVVNPIKN